MKFNNIDELLRYIISENVNLQYTDITFALNESIKSETLPKVENLEIKIISFFDSPSIKGIVENENILYVDMVEGNKNICGSGKVNVLGREIMTNLCESDGTAYVKLSIDINGKILENVQFKLQAAGVDTKNTIHIRKELLNE